MTALKVRVSLRSAEVRTPRMLRNLISVSKMQRQGGIKASLCLESMAHRLLRMMRVSRVIVIRSESYLLWLTRGLELRRAQLMAIAQV